MRGKNAFTLVELLVVISIIALLLSILLPALNKAKEQAKLAVCLSNMKQIGYAFKVYMQDNENRFPYNDEGGYFESGDAEFGYGGGEQHLGAMLTDLPDPEDRMLYPYAKEPDAFFCPADNGENLLPMEWWKPTTFYAMGASYRYNYNPWDNPLRGGGLAEWYGIANQKESWAPHPSRYIMLHEPPALCWTFYGGRYFLWHFARGETTVMDPELARSAFISTILFVDGHAGSFDFTEVLLQQYPCEPTAEWVWYKRGDLGTWGRKPPIGSGISPAISRPGAEKPEKN